MIETLHLKLNSMSYVFFFSPIFQLIKLKIVISNETKPHINGKLIKNHVNLFLKNKRSFILIFNNRK